MKLDQPFVRLPFAFDTQRLATELAQFSDSDWMAHPNGLAGNLAIPLISKGGEDNNMFCGHMQATPHLEACPYMQQVMTSFNEVLARSRLMRLNAGHEVTAHVDFNYHWYSRVRIHIPITTYPEVIFYCGDEERHMRAGECWLFDSWRWHNVVNGSDQDRVHLVIDTAGSSRFWNLIEKMTSMAESDIASIIQEVPYRPEATVELKTEQYNVSPIMSPGELEAIANEIVADFSGNPDNDKETVVAYTRLLRDLSKDWREVWHQFGFNSEGWRHYRRLLEQTGQKLRPNPRALVTNSNNVGVNPIIVQRILRAALNTEEIPNFSQH